MRKSLILILLTASICWGQGQLLIPPKFHADTSAGAPCNGCKVYSYTATTLTPLATYSDTAATVANANPVILDTRGEATIVLRGTSSYKIILKDANDVVIWTVDSISTTVPGPASVTATTTGYAFTVTQSGASGGGITVIPGADSGTGQEAIRIRNSANSLTAHQLWGNGNYTASGNGSFGGTFSATGATILSSTLAVAGNFAVNTSKFTANSTTGNVTQAGLTTSYNGIATVSNGVPSILGTVSLTAQTATIGLSTLYTVPASGAGVYRISYYAQITTADGVSSSLTPIFKWTNGGVIQTFTGAAMTGNTTTTSQETSFLIRSDASVTIGYQATYASNTPAAMNFSFYIRVEAL